MSNITVPFHKGFECDKKTCDTQILSAAKPSTPDLIADRIAAAKKKKRRFFKTRRLNVLCPVHASQVKDVNGTEL